MIYRIAVTAFWLQGISLGVGLAGMLFAMPHLAQYANDPRVLAFAMFMMQQGGMLDIMLGALTMAAFGYAFLGARNTTLFLAISVCVSAAAELTGTATGWPFGGYAYTGLLGAKMLGRVPYPIPFSWFSMGLASYILGCALANRFIARRPSSIKYLPDLTTIMGIVFGAALLTAWDLVLDPAMANESSALAHFWIWTEHGRYFGMPLRNLAGWFVTGVAFIGASRFAWRRNPPPSNVPLALPFGMYMVNVVWAMGLAASIHLWVPILLATLLGVVPAIAALPLYKRSNRLAA